RRGGAGGCTGRGPPRPPPGRPWRRRPRRSGPRAAASLRLRTLWQGADHVEAPLGHVLILVVQDRLAVVQQRVDRHGRPRATGERLGDVERLGKVALEAPRARDRALILLAELLEAEHRNDVLEVLVSSERGAHGAGH